jgi:hypothetical protein
MLNAVQGLHSHFSLYSCSAAVYETSHQCSDLCHRMGLVDMFGYTCYRFCKHNDMNNQ